MRDHYISKSGDIWVVRTEWSDDLSFADCWGVRNDTTTDRWLGRMFIKGRGGMDEDRQIQKMVDGYEE